MQAECPKCRTRSTFPDSLAGAEARCPSCGSLISLPFDPSGRRPDEPVPVGRLPEETAAAGQGDAARDSVFARLEGVDASEDEVLGRSEPGAGRRRRPRKRSQPLWTRVVMVGVPLLVVAGVLGGYAWVQAEREAYRQKTAASWNLAKEAYLAGKPEEADKLLGEALGMMDARPEAVPADWAGPLRKQAAEWRTCIGEWRAAGEVFRKVSIEPAATRRRLEDLLKRPVLAAESARPVAELVRGMMRKAFEQDLADRSKALEAHLAGLQAQLDAGEFDAAQAAVKIAREKMSKAPEGMDASLRQAFEPRLSALDAVFALRGDLEKIVKAAPSGGPKRLAVIEDLRKRQGEVKPGGPGEKGLARQFEKWYQELRADRRELPQPQGIGLELLRDVARDFAAAAPGLELDEKSLDEQRGLFGLNSAEHRYRVQVCKIGQEGAEQPFYLIEVDGIRLAYPAARNIQMRAALIRYEMTQAPLLAKVLKESGREEAWSADPWHVFLMGPLGGAEPTAFLRGKGLLCTAGRVWQVRGLETRQALGAAGQAFVTAARDLEGAVRGDREAGRELRDMLAMMVQAGYQPRASATDFLPRQFCARAVARGYIEKNAPELAARLAGKLAAYRSAYRNLTGFVPGLTGKTAAGDEIEWGVNADGRSLWRCYDSRSDTTTFALPHDDEQFRNQFFVHTVFAKKHASWPEAESPRAVHMVHQSVGSVASWDAATDKLTVDAERWRLATDVEQFRTPPAFYGASDWRYPPHVLLVDSAGGALGIVTPQGRLDMPEFGTRAGEERRKAQDAFLAQCAKVLRSAGELHLLFRYFVKYTYDSPLTDYPFLIGDKQNTGDVHQDAYQTLDRKIAGLFIADCDDLAELYQEITRLQGRLSYVLGRPSHAICGFVEKQGDEFVLTTVDTGLPREFRAAKLEDVIEAGFATFDEERTEAFDPNSVCFLLRFAGEPTRTPYFLGARMFVDPVYAKTMIRVQRDWHFAHIASGCHTMKEMVKRETDAPTLFELAGFYRELGDWTRAIEWSRKGIAALPPDDVMGKFTEHLRLAHYMDRSDDRKAAVETLLKTARDVEEAEAVAGADAGRFAGLRLNLAGDLDAMDRPWEAWKVARTPARQLAGAGKLGGNNITRLAVILLSMREAERSGRKPSDAEKAAADELQELLRARLNAGHFEESDTFQAHMDKYADLAIFYAARDGREKALEKLLAPGPYPSGNRAHHQRRGEPAALEEEDWKWIRISIHAYNYFLQRALDQRKPLAERRPQEAVRVVDALEKAAPEIRKQGALGAMEFAILSMRVRRDAISKNWEGMEKSFELMKKRNWARLYNVMAMSLGDSAPYMSVEDFEAQFRKFCDQSPPMPHYFRVVYDALSNKCYAAALAAARVIAERFPQDADVQREVTLLKELVKERGADAGPATGPGTGGAVPGPGRERPPARTDRAAA